MFFWLFDFKVTLTFFLTSIPFRLIDLQNILTVTGLWPRNILFSIKKPDYRKVFWNFQFRMTCIINLKKIWFYKLTSKKLMNYVFQASEISYIAFSYFSSIVTWNTVSMLRFSHTANLQTFLLQVINLTFFIFYPGLNNINSDLGFTLLGSLW